MSDSLNSRRVEIEKRARKMVGSLSTKRLLALYEMSNRKPMAKMTPEDYQVRGWIMDELEARDPEAFDRWIDGTDPSPRQYFL